MHTLHDKPVFPLLEIYKENYFDLIENVEILSRCRASAITSQYKRKSYCFDADGSKWSCTLDPVSYKVNPIKKILWYVGINPIVAVIPVFSKLGNYELNELKSVLKGCVDVDDDVITQFEEGHIIKEAIDKASDFKAILTVFEKYIYDPDEEQIWKEQEERGMPE